MCPLQSHGDFSRSLSKFSPSVDTFRVSGPSRMKSHYHHACSIEYYVSGRHCSFFVRLHLSEERFCVSFSILRLLRVLLKSSCDVCFSLMLQAPPSRTIASLKGNWEALWVNIGRDHEHAGLVWNEQTRAELREALQVSTWLCICQLCNIYHKCSFRFPTSWSQKRPFQHTYSGICTWVLQPKEATELRRILCCFFCARLICSASRDWRIPLLKVRNRFQSQTAVSKILTFVTRVPGRWISYHYFVLGGLSGRGDCPSAGTRPGCKWVWRVPLLEPLGVSGLLPEPLEAPQRRRDVHPTAAWGLGQGKLEISVCFALD